MFKFLIFILCILLNCSISAAASSCEQYLHSKPLQHPRQDLHSRAIDQLISINYELMATQEQWLRQIRLELKERSIPSRFDPDKAVPVVRTQTLRLMWDLQNTLVDSEEYHELLLQIFEDPYVEWLNNNWDDSKLRIPPSLVDLSVIQGTVWNPEGKIRQKAETFYEYLNQHLFFQGPMKLRPDLLILRIARDHDSNLPESLFNSISSVLVLQRSLYALDQLISELASNSFGTQVEWSEFKTLRLAQSEFMALKSKVSQDSPLGFEMEFLKAQARGDVQSNISFEDYLVNMYYGSSTDPEEMEIYQKYKLLKNIINISALVNDREELEEYLEMRVKYTLPYFLY